MRQSRQDRNEEVKTVCLSLGLEEVLRYKVQGERVLQGIGLGLSLELAILIFLNLHRHSVWVQTRSREAIGYTAFMPITCHCHLVTPPKGRTEGNLKPPGPPVSSFAEHYRGTGHWKCRCSHVSLSPHPCG